MAKMAKKGKNEDFHLLLQSDVIFPFLSVIAHIIHHYAPNLILQKLFWCNFGKIK